MNKGLTITLIVLLTILLFSLVGVMILLFNGKISFEGIRFASGYSEKLVEEKEINNISNLNIKTDIADVVVEEKDINNIKVELYSEKEPIYEITENTDTIYIVLKQKNKMQFGLFNKTPRIVVYVPNTFDKEIKVNGTTSDIKIGTLPKVSLSVKASTGDVKAKELYKANITLSTGDIKIDDIKELQSVSTTGDIKLDSADNVKMVTTTGDIKIQNKVDSIEAKTTTGDIRINEVNNSISLTTSTGDVFISKSTLKENSSITTGTGDVTIDSISGCYVEGTTKVGDTNINNSDKDRKSDVILKIKTRVGDIKVN